jgi:streptogramin lyase
LYAFAGFISDPLHVGSSGSTLALTALSNAGQTLNNLYSQTTGAALATTQAGNGTVPQPEINTLANILAACVNSTGPGSTPCTTLFSNAKNGSTAPTDTATAAVNIAHNPGANISNLYGLQTANSPFQPALTSAPNDFTIAIVYTGGGLYSPEGVAIDASGNVWVASSSLGGSINEFSPAGAAISGSAGYTGGGLSAPYGILIDTSGNVWASNLNGNSLSEFNPTTGAPMNSTGFKGAGLNEPEEITIDPSGHIWAANFGGNSLSEFNSSDGSPVNATAFTGGGLYAPLGLAVDTGGHVWIANTDGNVLSEFNTSNGQAVSATGYTGSLSYPFGVAVDGSGNIWVANEGILSSSISEFSSTGTVSSNSPITGGGLNGTVGLAIDGSGNVWTANLLGNTISEFSPAGAAISPSTGYGYLAAGLNDPFWIAIDGSGNVWVTNSSTGAKSLTEFVGAAAPVVTPIVANLKSPYGSHAVNKP